MPDPFRRFAPQEPREGRGERRGLGSGFIIDPSGYIAGSCVVALLHELALELHHNGAWPERQEPDQLAPAAPKRIAG